ncbi:MAG: glycosyltransferase family 4 protein [Planctomycetales bacterium]|nr:glycosyltransferase family 4 protein [Planctomycetales bacterium]
MSVQRLLYVVNQFPKISETFILEEVVELLRRHVEVQICSLNEPTETVKHAAFDEWDLSERTFYDSSTWTQLLQRFQPDIVHAHFATKPTEVALQLTAGTDVPVTFTAHGYDIYRKPPADLSGRAATAAAIVTVSDANADHLVQQFRVDRRKLQIVPCGINTELFCPGERRPAVPTIVCVARMSPVKNLSLLLTACEKLMRRRVDFQCVIVGDGRCRQDLELQRHALCLENNVTFAGTLTQHQVVQQWKRATVGVLSSTSEGMPVSLMEAAACGVPVVATDVGGVAELVRHGETGFVVPSENADSLADRLQQVLQDQALRQQFAAAARHQAVQRFSVVRQVDQLTKIWDAVCDVQVKA